MNAVEEEKFENTVLKNAGTACVSAYLARLTAAIC